MNFYLELLVVWEVKSKDQEKYKKMIGDRKLGKNSLKTDPIRNDPDAGDFLSTKNLEYNDKDSRNSKKIEVIDQPPKEKITAENEKQPQNERQDKKLGKKSTKTDPDRMDRDPGGFLHSNSMPLNERQERKFGKNSMKTDPVRIDRDSGDFLSKPMSFHDEEVPQNSKKGEFLDKPLQKEERKAESPNERQDGKLGKNSRKTDPVRIDRDPGEFVSGPMAYNDEFSQNSKNGEVFDQPLQKETRKAESLNERQERKLGKNRDPGEFLSKPMAYNDEISQNSKKGEFLEKPLPKEEIKAESLNKRQDRKLGKMKTDPVRIDRDSVDEFLSQPMVYHDEFSQNSKKVKAEPPNERHSENNTKKKRLHIEHLSGLLVKHGIPLIEYSKISIDRQQKLGQGSFAKVYRGKWLETQDVAVKIFRKDSEKVLGLDSIFSEIKAGCALNHPKINRIFGVALDPDSRLLVVQELAQGTLDQLLEESPPLERKHWLALEISEVLSILKTNKIIHRDLKPKNFLVTAAGSLQVCDFGSIKFMRNLETSALSQNATFTQTYAPPEILLNDLNGEENMRKVGYYSDVWSLGCIYYRMYFGRSLWKGFSEGRMFEFMIKGRLPAIEKEGDVPEEMVALIKKCLAFNGKERIKIEEVMKEMKMIALKNS